MEFADIFKENRKRIGYTQEEIAKRLMVTPQAVSKWENSSAMPDVTLIVPISRLFGITTDELLGNDFKSCDEISDELDEAYRLNDNIRERYNKYLDLAKLYPNSRDLLARLIGCTAELLATCGKEMSDDEKSDLITKAEALSDCMRKNGEKTRNNDYTYSHALLADVYISAGELEKAESEIEYLPYCRYNKARMLGRLRAREKKFDDAIEYYRESISDAIYWLFWDIERLAHCLWRATGDNTTSLKMFKLEYDLIHRLYEDKMYPIPVTTYLLQANIQLAADNARKGNHEIAYSHLEEIIEIIEAFDKGYGNTYETGCILYPSAIQPFNKCIKNISYKNWFLDKLEWNSFNPLKDDERFNNFLKRAETFK